MTAATVAAWATFVIVVAAVAPVVYVLARETMRRRHRKAAASRITRASGPLASGGDVADLAKSLRGSFDALTVDGAVEELLRDAATPARRELGARLFAELGLTGRFAARLREAKRWSDRAHAAELLGLAGATDAIPALVAALNDRFEDGTSVKTAAVKALARLEDPTAIPLLCAELRDAQEASARAIAEALVAFGTLAVAPVTALLADPMHRGARVWAARVLGRIGDVAPVEDLISRLQDRDDLLRMAAAEALGILADARAIQPLIRTTLRDPAPQVRAHAAEAVALIEGERAVDVLVAALSDPDYGTRLRALEALEVIRVEDTSHLESALRDPNVEVRRRAALALERVGYLDRIIRELTSEDRTVCARAYASTLELGQVGLTDSVVAYIHHESFEVRALIARICGELGVARVAPLLRGRLNDDEWPVRAAICEALGRLKAPETVPALVEVLVDPEETVREAAAEALTSFPPAELAPRFDALAQAYDAGSVVVRTQMIVLVSRFVGDEGRAAEPLLVRASADTSDAVRLRAVSALADRDDAVRVAPLLARLTDPALEVRMAAVAGLGSAATTEAFEGLLGALTGAAPALRDRIADALSRGARQQLFLRLDDLEPTLDIQLGVTWTLGKCGDVRGIPFLAQYLRDPNPVLRASAAGALAKIDDRDARDALLTAADDPNGRVRAAVANALGRAPAGDERVISVLARATRDPDPFVRNRALVSLARVAGRSVEAELEELSLEASVAARLVAGALIATERSLDGVLDRLVQPGMLEEVTDFLGHEDAQVRIAFFQAVHLDDPGAEGPPAEGVPALVAQYESLLRTSLDAASRRFAVRALGRIEGGRSADVLADVLASDPAEDVRVQAADALARRVNDPIARRAIVRAVGDPSPEIALRALHAIAGRREPEIAAALTRRLGAGEPEVRALTESTLAAIHRDDPWPFLDWMMGVDVPELLVPAIRVLGHMASPVATPLLREMLRSRAASVRAAAVRALAAAPDAEPGMLPRMVEDPSDEVRVAVLDSVVWTSDALVWARPVRHDPSAHVRACLATSLGRFDASGARAALKLLGSLVEDAAPEVRAAALVGLMVFRDGAGLVEFARAWAETALEARFALRGVPGAERITSRLAELLSSSPDPTLRRAAVTAVGALGDASAEDALAPSLDDPSSEVRIAAIHALASLETPTARQRLVRMMSDPDVAVRETARRSVVRPA